MAEPSSLRLVGKTIGHYRVLAVLGEGGMGVVYRALDERLRRNVALKVLPDDAVRSEEKRRRFMREARSAAAISHANVATVHEVGEAGGHVYIAMELIEGRTLHDELASIGHIPLPEAIRIARAIAAGLAKAHEKGIVHRDLKPENVMLGDENEVKVLDFGLAKLLEDKSSKSLLEIDETATGATLDGRVIGTPAYMSPEQAMGVPLDARTDVFSFGVVLYQMLSGARPFNGLSPLQIMVAVTRDDPASLESQVEGLTPELRDLVARCLSKEPAKRYANGRALLEAIDAMNPNRSNDTPLRTLASPGTAVPPGKSIETVTKDSSRRPSRGARGPLVGLLVAAGLAVAAFAFLRSSSPAAPRALKVGAGPSTAAGTSTAPHVAEAVSLFARALREEREGRYEVGCGDASRASDLDPSFAEADLFATLCHRAVPREGRTYFRRAWDVRDTLPPNEAAMVEAQEPIFQRDPEDDAEQVRRLRDIAKRFPDDAQAHLILAVSLRRDGEDAEASRELTRSLELDPRQPHAFELQSDYLAYDGDFDRAGVAIDKCLELAPSAIGCILERIWIDGEHGDCAAVETSARRMLTVDAENDDAERALANALFVEGRPIATSRELMKRIAEHHPHDLSTRLDAIHVATMAGDFGTAEKLALALRADASASTVAAEHAIPAETLVAIYQETKRDADASAIAAEYLDGRDAWEPEARLEDWAIANEPTPMMLAARFRVGGLTHEQFAAERAKTLKRWDARVEKSVRSFLWIYAWAAPVESKADALEAIAAIPGFAPLPAYKPLSLADEIIGRAYLLAGDLDSALPPLTRASASCFALDHPIENTRAYLMLGQAREAKGDIPAACAAYSVVRDRWAGAKPRSISAEKAAARMTALRCN